jgi:hypothetical protein
MRESFSIFECSLARKATGRVCTNLRELLDAVRTVPDAVLVHHMIRCALEDHFELHEFPNDLARWCWGTLGDNVLGEQLGLIDPYVMASTAALRETISNIIEERLWHLERVPWCRPGCELHLVESRLISFDTGERAVTPMELRDAIERMTLRSLFYHVHEARRRNAGRSDDFSLWLESFKADSSLITRIRAIDFYFLNLTQLRCELLAAFHAQPTDSHTAGGAAP